MTTTTGTGGWAPYFPQLWGADWVVMTSWWERDRAGDWDMLTERADDLTHPDRDTAQAVADRLNAEWRVWDKAQRDARQAAARQA